MPHRLVRDSLRLRGSDRIRCATRIQRSAHEQVAPRHMRATQGSPLVTLGGGLSPTPTSWLNRDENDPKLANPISMHTFVTSGSR